MNVAYAICQWEMGFPPAVKQMLRKKGQSAFRAKPSAWILLFTEVLIAGCTAKAPRHRNDSGITAEAWPRVLSLQIGCRAGLLAATNIVFLHNKPHARIELTEGVGEIGKYYTSDWLSNDTAIS